MRRWTKKWVQVLQSMAAILTIVHIVLHQRCFTIRLRLRLRLRQEGLRICRISRTCFQWPLGTPGSWGIAAGRIDPALKRSLSCSCCLFILYLLTFQSSRFFSYGEGVWVLRLCARQKPRWQVGIIRELPTGRLHWNMAGLIHDFCSQDSGSPDIIILAATETRNPCGAGRRCVCRNRSCDTSRGHRRVRLVGTVWAHGGTIR